MIPWKGNEKLDAGSRVVGNEVARNKISITSFLFLNLDIYFSYLKKKRNNFLEYRSCIMKNLVCYTRWHISYFRDENYKGQSKDLCRSTYDKREIQWIKEIRKVESNYWKIVVWTDRLIPVEDANRSKIFNFATLFYNIMRSGCVVARRSFSSCSSVCETSLLSAILLNERGERERERKGEKESWFMQVRVLWGNTALKTRPYLA